MNLSEAFDRLASWLDLDRAALDEYAAEDEIGGWPVSREPHVDWPGGSIWAEEGKFLYALVRSLQPDLLFESGTKWGCSTTHILTALKANKKGELTSVDLGFDTDTPQDLYGSMIPKAVKKKWTFNFGVRSEDFLDGDNTPFQFAYEDTDHTVPTTVAILSRLKARESIKTIVSHDICHPWVGYAMRDSWTQVFGDQGTHWQAFCIEPSDCGLAVWRRH